MFHLTQQERQVILFVTLVFLTGTVVRSAVFFFPSFEKRVVVLDDDAFRPKVDINHATFDELLAVPHIGEWTARAIVCRRESAGSFRSLEDLRQLAGIREGNFLKMKKYLRVN